MHLTSDPQPACRLSVCAGRRDPAAFDAATHVLLHRGWTTDEIIPLLDALEVDAVGEGATVLIKGRTIDFVVLVMRGSVTHGTHRYGPGDFLGAQYAISGHQVLDDALVESPDAFLGALSTSKLEALATSHPALARKVFTMLGVVALGLEFDAHATAGRDGGAAGAPTVLGVVSAAAADGESAAARDQMNSAAVPTEVLFRTRQLEGQRAALVENVESMQRERQRDASVLERVRREKEALMAQAIATVEERKAAMLQSRRYKAALDRSADEVRMHVHSNALEGAPPCLLPVAERPPFSLPLVPRVRCMSSRSSLPQAMMLSGR